MTSTVEARTNSPGWRTNGWPAPTSTSAVRSSCWIAGSMCVYRWLLKTRNHRPRRRDLGRDGRYALHSYPPEDSDDEAYVSGRARQVTDQARVSLLAGTMRAKPDLSWRLYEFTVDTAMIARRRHGEYGPVGVV